MRRPQITNRRTAALREGSAAVGASRLRDGFCFRKEDDLAFALGYPYIRYLVDDHPEDANPRASAERALIEEPHLRLSYGADTAQRVARALTIPQPFELDSRPGLPTLVRRARETLEVATPLDAGEVTARIHAMFAAPFASPSIAEALLLFEAVVGTRVVVDTVTSVLQSLDVSIRWDAPKTRAVTTVGIMMLRLDVETDGKVRRRLAVARERIGEAQSKYVGIVAVLDGGGVAPPLPVVGALDEVVRAARAASPVPWYAVPDPRLVFLGGDEVYRTELALWPEYTDSSIGTATHTLIIERFGPIRSPLTVELMLDMATRSSAKAAAQAWLKEHIAFAEPTLQRLGSEEHPLAGAAREALGVRPL